MSEAARVRRKRISLRRWRKVVERFVVHSYPDGTMAIAPICSVEPVEPGCPVLGFHERLALAKDIEELLNQRLKP